jgi:ribosomal protein S18 acetylase RimI-like enzyme
VRGLRLYVRPIEAGDAEAVGAFLRASSPASPLPAHGLLGKLLGDIVAVVGTEVTGETLRIEQIVVASQLRRKWIGRGMVREVEQLATRCGSRQIVVENAGEAQEFFRRVGFEDKGDRWVRNV